ncbi:MAG: contractile injection system protein, VgrG/Pvc8 family [Planctomycetota bacterium]
MTVSPELVFELMDGTPTGSTNGLSPDQPPYLITEEAGFVPVSMTVKERLCRPFRIVLDLAIDASKFVMPDADLVGSQVSIRINPASSDTDDVSVGRYLHGYVNRFVRIGEVNGATRFRAFVGPGLWPLGRSVRTRIFHNRSVIGIVKQLLDDVGCQPYDISDDAQYMVWDAEAETFPAYEQVVQYKESDLDLLHRLLEQEGLWYRFKPIMGTDADGVDIAVGHQFVLNEDNWLGVEDPASDTAAQNTYGSTLVLAGNDSPGLESLAQLQETGAEQMRGTDWMGETPFRQQWPERVQLNAFEYNNADGSDAIEKGLRRLTASTTPGLDGTINAGAIERGYDDGEGDETPSEPIDRFDLDDSLTNVGQRGGQAGYSTSSSVPGAYMQYHAHIAVERRYWRKHLIEGYTDARAIRPGVIAKVVGTGTATVTEQRIRVITSESVYNRIGNTAAETDRPTACAVRFRAIPEVVPYRPTKKAPVPEIPGVVTATVVTASPSGTNDVDDPANDPVFDELGRTRVRFHWHRAPTRADALDDTSRFDDDDASSNDWTEDALAETLQYTAWVRVAQPHVVASDRGGGSTFVPAIGSEVLVQFIGGSPDRPVIVGALYNAEHRVIEELNRRKASSDSNRRRDWSPWHTTIADQAGNEVGLDGTPGSETIYLTTKPASGRSGHGFSGTSYFWLGRNWTDKVEDALGNDSDERMDGAGFYTDGDMRYWVEGKRVEIVKGSEIDATWGNKFEFTGGTQGEAWIGAQYGISLAAKGEVSIGAAFEANLGAMSISLDYTFAKYEWSAATIEHTFRAGDASTETFGDALYRAVGESKFHSFGETEILGGIPSPPTPPSEGFAAGGLALGTALSAGAMAAVAASGGSPAGIAGATALGVAGLGSLGTAATTTVVAQSHAKNAVDTALTAAKATVSRVRLKSDQLLLASGQSRIKIGKDGDIEILRAKKHGIKITASGVEIIGPLKVGDLKFTGTFKEAGTVDVMHAPAVVPPNPPITE